MEKYGHFDFETGEYIINTHITSRPMENFLFNERYFALVYNNGSGMSKYVDASGHFTDIVEGTNEIGFVGNTRLIYIKDEETGKFWNAGFSPVCLQPDAYECRQGPGYTVITNTTDGITAVWRMFVPEGEEPVELWTLELKNIGNDRRKLSLFAFTELSLNTPASLYGHVSYLNSCILKKANGVAARKIAMNLPHPYFGAIFLSSYTLKSCDARMDSFTGQFRTLSNPVAVCSGMCSGSISSRDRVGSALHNSIELGPGCSFRADYLAGAVNVFNVEEEASALNGKYLVDKGKTIDNVFEQTKKSIGRRLQKNSMITPDPMFNVLHNFWLPQLVEFGVTHCRCGTFGFRDIVQQAQGATLTGSREKSRERLKQAFSYQYSAGNAVRSFPVVHSDSRMKYADSAFWLISAAVEYLKETGDRAFLECIIPYLDGKDGTVWEHMQKSIDIMESGMGPHGLCLIYEGDWNDSFTHVGRRGLGESIMLSESFCYACLLMEELAFYLGNENLAGKYRKSYEYMKKNLLEYAWDGEWFIRAFNDKGTAIGSKACEEGRIYLNAQAWAIIAEVAGEDKIEPMLKSLKKHLLTPYGYMLHYPAYTKLQEDIGRVTCLEPGCSENASVYMHGNAFLILALLKLGQADEAHDVLCRIAPYNPDNPSTSVLPYQYSNGYSGIDHRYDPGRSLYGWMTGSGSWIYLSILDYMFGLKKTYDGLVIRPCLPSCWKDVFVRRDFRGCTYEVRYKRKGGKNSKITTISINGAEHDPEKPLPAVSGTKYSIEVFI